MKKFLFAAFAALSMIAVSAHADAVNIAKSETPAVVAPEAVPAASVAEKVGKFTGMAITSPFALIKSVAPTALDGIKSAAGDFKDGFVKGASSLTGSTPAVSQENGEPPTSGRPNDSVEKAVIVSAPASAPTAVPALPPHVLKAFAFMRSPMATNQRVEQTAAQ